jgi:aryl-alcohol dehydrogenase-like predicted oxidoreductase
VCSLQLRINLLDRRMLDALSAARQRGVAVIARECLANGLLAREKGEGAAEPAEAAADLHRYRAVASASGSTLPQLALHFVTSLEGVSVALVGAHSEEQLSHLLRHFATSPAAGAIQALQA